MSLVRAPAALSVPGDILAGATVATGLTGAGLGLAAVSGGGSPSPHGSRGNGAVGALARGAVPALLAGAHTYTITALSRHEISGAPARLPATTLAVSSATALSTVLPSILPAVMPPRREMSRETVARTAVASAGVLAYLGTYGRAQACAVRDPGASSVRRAVGAGILAMVPLQAALTARAGAPVAAALLGAVHPVAQRLAKRVSPT